MSARWTSERRLSHTGTPAVAILDDSRDLCLAMSRLIELRLSVRSVTALSFDEFVAQKDTIFATRIAFLDVNLGEGRPSGLDACKWLRAHEYRGQILFLSGHAPANFPGLDSAGAQFRRKPLPTAELIELVRGAL